MSENVAVVIIGVIVLSLAGGILLLRDKWRDHVGMPKAERERSSANAGDWGGVMLGLLFGLVGLAKFAYDPLSPDRRGFGLEAAMMLSWAFISLFRLRRRRAEARRRHHQIPGRDEGIAP